MERDNAEPCDVLVHVSVFGQIHRQSAGLPEGTRRASVEAFAMPNGQQDQSLVNQSTNPCVQSTICGPASRFTASRERAYSCAPSPIHRDMGWEAAGSIPNSVPRLKPNSASRLNLPFHKDVDH